MAKIPKPTQKELEKWLDNWEKMENYRNQENALNKLFHETYPKNNDINEILIKVATLNDFYSTHILKILKILTIDCKKAMKNWLRKLLKLV